MGKRPPDSQRALFEGPPFELKSMGGSPKDCLGLGSLTLFHRARNETYCFGGLENSLSLTGVYGKLGGGTPDSRLGTVSSLWSAVWICSEYGLV